MSQALHLANGDTINEKLRSDTSAPAREAVAGHSDAEVLDRLFLAALSRHPTAAENDRMKTVLHEDSAASNDPKARVQARRQALEDLYWATLTSKDFMFNH
jgi:hypothetical protein